MQQLTKVLFMAMDAGDKYLLQSWADDGSLPVIASLMKKGLVGDTMSLDSYFIGSIWPSLYTGVSPANHSFHYLVQIVPGSYEFVRYNPDRNLKRDPFWYELSDMGKKVAILDIPMSYLSDKKVNGIQVIEWGSHDSIYGFKTFPKELKREILSNFGSYPQSAACDGTNRDAEAFCDLRDLYIKGVQNKAALTKYYLRKGQWDFFAQVFTESHCIGHQCWHLHDPNHPSHDPDMAKKTGDPLRDIYQEIDQAIGDILHNVDKETIVIFLAGHRMAHNAGANFLLPEILARLNVMHYKPGQHTVVNEHIKESRFQKMVSWGWQLTPPNIKKEIRSLRKYLHQKIAGRKFKLPPALAKIDYENSLCFPVYNGLLVSGIRVNVVGREPKGKVQQGDEFESLFKQIAFDLERLKDLDTGKPVVKSVKKNNEIYQGPYQQYLPDILVEWNDERAMGSTANLKTDGSRLRIASKKTGVIEGDNSYNRTGDHRPEGLFIALGPGIEAARLDRTVSIMDFAPSIVQLLGGELKDTDGSPIPELCHHSWLQPS